MVYARAYYETNGGLLGVENRWIGQWILLVGGHTVKGECIQHSDRGVTALGHEKCEESLCFVFHVEIDQLYWSTLSNLPMHLNCNCC